MRRAMRLEKYTEGTEEYLNVSKKKNIRELSVLLHFRMSGRKGIFFFVHTSSAGWLQKVLLMCSSTLFNIYLRQTP